MTRDRSPRWPLSGSAARARALGSTLALVALGTVPARAAAGPDPGAVVAAGAGALTPAPAPTPAPREPTGADLAAIDVPSVVAPPSDFARRLAHACGALGATNAPAPAATSFRLAPLVAAASPATGSSRAPGALAPAVAEALSGLRRTCQQIDGGQRLDAVDLDNLRAFRADPGLADARIALLLNVAAATPAGTVASTFTSAGSLEANVIAGLAQFIYDRARQEAVLYLGRQLGERLCAGTNRLFFPDLCLAIGTSDPPLSLAAMGSYLAIAARRDLARLPDRVLAYQLFRLPPTAATTARETLVAARLGLAYFRAVAAGRTPLDAARGLHRIPASFVGADATVFGATARASELLDAVVAQQGWTDVSTATDAVARRFALGVIFSLEDLFHGDGLTFPAPSPDQIADLVPLVARYLAEARAVSERAQQALASLRGGGTPAMSGRGDFTPAGGGGGGDGRGDASGGGGASGGDPAGASAWDLGTRDYLAASTQTLGGTLQAGVVVAQKLGVLSPAAAATVARIDEVIELGEQMVWGKSPSELMIVGLDLLTRLSQRLDAREAAEAERTITDLRGVVVLMAQIAQAQSADEVAQILEAAAAPVSSYETKYRQPVIALGALVGAAVGFEGLRTGGAGWSTGGVAGAFAPVGITASAPACARWHLGGMLSVINLGGLVSTRFTEDTRTNAAGATTTVKADPTIKLANVFAPGLFFTLGIYGSPFTFSAGGQVVPQGRQVVQPDGTSTSAAALQLLATLSLDVPILKF